MMSSLPISTEVYERWDSICEAFSSPDPLPHFVVIPNFLNPAFLAKMKSGCQNARLETFCGRIGNEDADIENSFSEPEENQVYVTIHQRPRDPLPELDEINDSFSSPQMVELMSKLYGARLNAQGHCGVLTSWGPHSFIEPHTDQGTPEAPSRLAIALSLTEQWRPEYGGATYFEWGDQSQMVRVQPRFNNAVLFETFSGSYHWVEQISGDAPPRTRFTWTFSYL